MNEPTGEVYDKIKGHAVTQSDTEPDAQKKLEEAAVYAEQLATSLAARWYPEVSQWRPLRGDLIGLLTQIDNMTTGAVRAQSDAEPVAWQLVPKKPTKEMIQAAYDRERDGTTVLYFKMWNAMLDAAPAPPRPHVSAGLIEAAAAIIHTIRDKTMCGLMSNDWLDGYSNACDDIVHALRARAVDRSGK